MAVYAFKVTFDGTIEEARQRVTDELAKEGFGILTEIDVKATLKKKLDVDRRPYLILGACNPKLANDAINAEPDIGILLPCNVVVREEEDGSTTVAFMEPGAVLGIAAREDLGHLGQDARARLERASQALIRG